MNYLPYEKVQREKLSEKNEKLKQAVFSNNIEEASKYIELGADVNLRYEKITTFEEFREVDTVSPLLSAAIGNRNFKMAKLLIDNGANPNTRFHEVENVIPLELAVDYNSLEIVELLIDSGAKRGASLHKAAKAGKKEIVEILLKKSGAEACLLSKKNGTPLDLAIEYGRDACIKLLIAPTLLESSEITKPNYIETKEDLSSIWDSALVEIRKMKNEKIPEKYCSFYDFLNLAPDVLAQTINKKALNTFKELNLDEKFPNYSILMQNRLEKLEPLIEQRYKYLDLFSECTLSSKDERVILNKELNSELLKYLPTNDIKNLLKASKNKQPAQANKTDYLDKNYSYSPRLMETAEYNSFSEATAYLDKNFSRLPPLMETPEYKSL